MSAVTPALPAALTDASTTVPTEALTVAARDTPTTVPATPAGLAPPIRKVLHTIGMLCIDYNEACQRKERANSWDFSTASAEKKYWDFVHAR
jgi:hypothetical protein